MEYCIILRHGRESTRKILEKVDEALLRGILAAHPKIPIEALFLETKSIPIRYILASRRILYLHSILQKDESELVRRIYEAQKSDPSQGDFVELVKQDCENIKLSMSDREISRIPKQRFRNIVKEKISHATFIYLQTKQKVHSKMQNLKYLKFELSSYMNSPLFSNNNRSLLLALRTRTVRGIRNDFKGLYSDNTCPLKCGDIDTIENILTCRVLRQHHTSNEVTRTNIDYQDIFSQDVEKQQKVTELYNQLLETRNHLIQSIPVASYTGPVHGRQAVQNQNT